MSDYLETLVADYLNNFGVSTPPTASETVEPTQEQSEPITEEVAPEVPKKRKRNLKKKNDQE